MLPCSWSPSSVSPTRHAISVRSVSLSAHPACINSTLQMAPKKLVKSVPKQCIAVQEFKLTNALLVTSARSESTPLPTPQSVNAPKASTAPRGLSSRLDVRMRRWLSKLLNDKSLTVEVVNLVMFVSGVDLTPIRVLRVIGAQSWGKRFLTTSMSTNALLAPTPPGRNECLRTSAKCALKATTVMTLPSATLQAEPAHLATGAHLEHQSPESALQELTLTRQELLMNLTASTVLLVVTAQKEALSIFPAVLAITANQVHLPKSPVLAVTIVTQRLSF